MTCRGQRLAWLALASHNLSGAAWGRLQKKGAQLYIMSFELGVLLTPARETAFQCHRHCTFSSVMPGMPYAYANSLTLKRTACKRLA